jgi:hypothetical protein
MHDASAAGRDNDARRSSTNAQRRTGASQPEGRDAHVRCEISASTFERQPREPDRTAGASTPFRTGTPAANDAPRDAQARR